MADRDRADSGARAESSSTFRPSRWLPGGHAQTIFGTLLRAFPRPKTTRERWDLPDGDFIDVDLLAAPAGAPSILLLHGLEGSARSHYVRGMLALAGRHGLQAFALNFRSCSEEPNRLLRSYHSGETEDLGFAVQRVLARTAGPLLLCGFSLGGNVLVKWLGEQGADVPRRIAAAAAVSVPFDLAACAASLDGPGAMSWAYRERFLRTLKKKAIAKASAFAGLDPAKIAAARTLGEFDEVVTAPVHGFADAADYWRQCSSGPYVSRVRAPLLLVSAIDDPIVPGGGLPPDRFAGNPLVTLEATAQGGHVGFVTGPPWAPRFWAEDRAMKFFSLRLAEWNKQPSAL